MAAKKRASKTKTVFSKPPSKEWFRGPPPESALNRIADALDRFASEVAKGRLVDQERMERFDRESAESLARSREDQDQQRKRILQIDREREEDRVRMRKIDEERGREPRSPHPGVPSHVHQFPLNFCVGVRFCGACGAEDREAG